MPVDTNPSAALPPDCLLRPLKTHADDRGQLTEVFRNEWFGSPLPSQWHVGRTEANGLRGVYVQDAHWSYLCVIMGEMAVGLHDMRPEASHGARSAMLLLSSGRLHVLAVAPGVAYGFYSPARSTYVGGSSAQDPNSSRQRLRWDSPELGLDWPCAAPILLPADRDAPGYAECRSAFLARGGVHGKA